MLDALAHNPRSNCNSSQCWMPASPPSLAKELPKGCDLGFHRS